MKLHIDNITHLMNSRGWTERRFAQKLKLDPTYIYRLLTESRYTLVTEVIRKALKSIYLPPSAIDTVIDFIESEI